LIIEKLEAMNILKPYEELLKDRHFGRVGRLYFFAL